MRKFALSLILVLASTAFAFAAAKTEDSTVDSTVTKVSKAAKGSKVAAGKNVKASANGHAAGAKEDAKPGVITIKGKAGSVTNIDYGPGVKSETNAGSVKAGGQ